MSIEIPLTIGVRGDITLRLRNMVTGEVEDERHVKNMIHNNYTDAIFTPLTGNMLTWGATNPTSVNANPPFIRCFIGTGTAAVTRTQGIDQALGAVVTRSAITKSAQYANPVWVESLFVFPAESQYVGAISEIAVECPFGVPAPRARQLVSPPINKTINHQLEITWRLSVDFGTRSWSGVIAGGQRDGTTDIAWALTVNDRQMMTWCMRTTADLVADNFTNRSNALSRLFQSGTVVPQVVCGDSNTASNLAADLDYTLKGSELFSGAVASRTAGAFTSGDFERESEIMLDVGQATGSIGEMVVCSALAKSTANSYGGLFRVTFDPPLDKAADYQMKLKFKIKLDLT